MPVDARARRVAGSVARDAMVLGARAVVLTGSHARGNASAHSDIDLIAIVNRARQERAWRPISRRGGYLVTVAWETPASVRAAFRDPALFPTFVPGWRDSIILDDPDGVALRLQRRAQRWSWEEVADVCDTWVAESIVGWAEEVHKLVSAMESGHVRDAAVQRSILAVHLAPVMAVHLRLLCGTENGLWDLVGEQMGEQWASTQARSLGERGESLQVSCRAALDLYRIAAACVRAVLGREQRAVVDHACEIADVGAAALSLVWAMIDDEGRGMPRPYIR
jgi:nucleotidyltransferase-like protein